MITKIMLLIGSMAVSGSGSIGCGNEYYRISLPAKTEPVSIQQEARSVGGYAALAKRDREDRTKFVQDSSISASEKAALITFMDQNIRRASCWAALSPKNN